MTVHTCSSPKELGAKAADAGAHDLAAAIAERGRGVIIVATGASQFDMLEQLVTKDIDWSRVTAFHLDEYIGLPVTHPASFRKYLKERFVERLPGGRIGAFHYVEGDAADPRAECARLGALISATTVDVAFVGIGENGHLAFNDPPADFATREPYLVVDLDEACRRQQLGEGWFPDLAAVPARAISMSCREILRARSIIVSVPDQRKAKAVACTVKGPVSPDCPASILQEHDRCSLFLDPDSASLLA